MVSLSVMIALSLVGFILLFFFITICRIFYAIWFPTIIAYPYPKPPSLPVASSVNDRRREERTVVFAGSFNPIHIGHLMMIQEYMIYHYSKVIIVIGTNPKKLYDVTAYQRADLIRKVIRNSNNKFLITNCIVQVVSNDYIWRIVKRQGATLFIRGIRTWELDGKDEQRLQFQNLYGPIVLGPLWYPMPTIFLQGKPQYNHISSTYLRNLIQQYTGGGRIKLSEETTDTTGTGSTSMNDVDDIINENNDLDKDDALDGVGEDATDSQQKQEQRQKQQKDRLYAILRQKLITMIPESIVDDVIQLYGKDSITGSGGGGSMMIEKNNDNSLLMQKDKSI